MGTNFYVAGYEQSGHDPMDPAVHIGKRSAAGRYCWDCRVTLCRDGTRGLHQSPRVPRRPGEDVGTLFARYLAAQASCWYECCPTCGAAPSSETLATSAAGRELGFNDGPPAPRRGVQSCSSFSWAMEPSRVEGIEQIEDEYGRTYTRAEFLAVLDECPIQFTHSIGEWFC